MNDSSTTEKDLQESSGPLWGQVRLGQLVILVELIAHVQATRQDKDSQRVSFVCGPEFLELSSMPSPLALHFLLRQCFSLNWSIALVQSLIKRCRVPPIWSCR